MSLAAGTKLGHYEILTPIGAGGMGEVYRAKDTKLKREVALKVLPESFAEEPERMARFQREAELLAALNHRNIAHIYGVEDGALVMELVEGDEPKNLRVAEGSVLVSRRGVNLMKKAKPYNCPLARRHPPIRTSGRSPTTAPASPAPLR
jgi:serine/threonine protein kinase